MKTFWEETVPGGRDEASLKGEKKLFIIKGNPLAKREISHLGRRKGVGGNKRLARTARLSQ